MNQKTNFVLSLLLAFCVIGLQAQEAVVATGGDATGTGGSASYTVGEAVYSDISDTGGDSYQGVQQPYSILSGIAENEHISLTMSVYPNPTVTSITLQIDDLSLDELRYQLYDIEGKIIATVDITSTLTEISMESLAAGTYYLSVSDSKQSLQTFPIIKNY